LYYTSFAVRALSALNALNGERALKCGRYILGLRTQPGGAFSDAVSIAAWWDSIALCEEAIGNELAREARLESGAVSHTRLNLLRRPDGGWSKTTLEGNGSLYHTLLASCAYYRMGRTPPDPEAIRKFLKEQEQPGGGFLENKFSQRPGVNGSMAGIGLAMLLNEEIDFEKHSNYLKTMRGSDGGFIATPNAPMEDLLSTFTGVFGLTLMGQGSDEITQGALKYARAMEAPNGGYAGFALESVQDCEYTFYGLGIEALAAGVDLTAMGPAQ
jgi:hypothetical protein